MLIHVYIYDIFSTNMDAITVSITKYEPLLEGISAYAEHIKHYFVVFSEGGGQIF